MTLITGSCTVFTEHVLENIEQQYNDLYQRFACWCQLAESVLVLLLIMIPNTCFLKLDELMSERPGDAVLISHSSAGFLTMACWVIELQYIVVYIGWLGTAFCLRWFSCLKGFGSLPSWHIDPMTASLLPLKLRILPVRQVGWVDVGSRCLLGFCMQGPSTPEMAPGSVSKPCTPVVHIKIVGKWMFIPLKFILIGFDPYPPGIDPTLALRLRRSVLSRDVQAFHRRMTAPVVRSHPSEGPQGIHGILLYMVLVTWIPSWYPKC